MKEHSSAPKAKSSGGRPSREQAGQIEQRILDSASHLFLTQGYGATSIEAIARHARISKRTFYHRFDDKGAIFAAVIHRLATRLRPKDESNLFSGHPLKTLLLALARLIVHAAVSPDAISLQRMVLSEAVRIPEMAHILDTQGPRKEAVERIAGLLQEETQKGHIGVNDPHFAAEQFLQMVMSLPQRRAMGIGSPMSESELEDWAVRTVDLFLLGCKVK